MGAEAAFSSIPSPTPSACNHFATQLQRSSQDWSDLVFQSSRFYIYKRHGEIATQTLRCRLQDVPVNSAVLANPLDRAPAGRRTASVFLLPCWCTPKKEHQCFSPCSSFLSVSSRIRGLWRTLFSCDTTRRALRWITWKRSSLCSSREIRQKGETSCVHLKRRPSVDMKTQLCR